MREQEYGAGKYTKNFSPAVWKTMWPFVKPYRDTLARIFAFLLIAAVIDVAIPQFLGFAVDNFINMQSLDGFGWYVAVYIGIVLLQALITILISQGSINAEMKLGRDLKRASFVRLQALGFSFYNQNAVGWILARVMSDTNHICFMVAWVFTDFFWCVAYVILAFAMMIYMNWRLALLVLAVIPFVIAITFIFQSRFLSVQRRMRHTNSRITGAFNEGITGAKTSKTLVIEDKNSQDFAQHTKDMYKISLRSTRLNAFFIPVISFFTSLTVAFVLVRGGQMEILGGMSLGTFSVFMTYVLGLLGPVQQIAHIMAEAIATQANIERVNTLLTTEPDIVDTPEVCEKYGDTFNPKTENWEDIKGDIEFRNVWFKYPDGDEWVLEDFSLKIPAGTNIALVGETGAGKSTLVNLACRFYEPTKGTVLIDGEDVRKRSQLWLHSRLGYVLQNPHLFSGTVKENIRYGRLDASDDEIYEAARLVSADLVVAKLENGYETDVGEGGDRLSTGEKQLISFARAVLANPPIFVLDEATSSIDTETERLIQDAIAHILTGRTSFLVAHRLSTIRHADLILVVKAGRIIERGTHDELMKERGYYHGLYTAMRIDETK